MKTLLFFFMLPFFSYAAEPTRLEGVFHYAGSELSSAKWIELVPVENSRRLRELISQNYECRNAQRFFKCSKTSTIVETPEYLKDEIEAIYSIYQYEFVKSANGVNVTNEAPDITEWEILDTVTGIEGIAEKYSYSLLTGGISKIRVPFKTGDQYFVINNEEKISTHYFKNHQTGKFTSVDFSVLIHFTK